MRCSKMRGGIREGAKFCNEWRRRFVGEPANASRSAASCATGAFRFGSVRRATARGLSQDGALFADVKGSTELMADLDPEEARAIVDPAGS